MQRPAVRPWVLAVAALAACPACDRATTSAPGGPPPGARSRDPAGADRRATQSPAPAPAPRPVAIAARPGISELEPGATLPSTAGQSIHVPAYASLVTDDGTARLTIHLSVRNLDESRPIIVTAVRHRDADGRPVRDHLRAPARLAPRAVLEVVLRPGEAGLGAASSFLVEWVADRPVVPPIAEAVMLGPPGIALVARGIVIEDRSRPGQVPPR